MAKTWEMRSLGLQCSPDLRAKLPADETVFGALRCDDRRASSWFARASFTSAADQPARVAAQRCFCNSACTVEGRIATSTASVHERAAQISIVHRAGHACSMSCISGIITFVESLRTVRGARAAEFASAYAALRLQLGLRRSSCCAGLHANAMEYARKPSQRLGQRLTVHCDGRS
jgi:hypothetical protein